MKKRTTVRTSGRGRAKKTAPRRAGKPRVSPIPAGTHTVTPHLMVEGAARAIDFYRRALGARQRVRMAGPGGSIMHAEIQIGDSRVYLADPFPGMDQRHGLAAALHLYVRDVDRAVARAVAAGAQVTMPAADMFWGDRYAKVVDPFGHQWGFASQREIVSPREMTKRAQAFLAQMQPGQP